MLEARRRIESEREVLFTSVLARNLDCMRFTKIKIGSFIGQMNQGSKNKKPNGLRKIISHNMNIHAKAKGCALA